MATKSVGICPRHTTSTEVCHVDPAQPNVHYSTPSGSGDFARVSAIQAQIDKRKAAGVDYAGKPSAGNETLIVTV